MKKPFDWGTAKQLADAIAVNLERAARGDLPEERVVTATQQAQRLQVLVGRGAAAAAKEAE